AADLASGGGAALIGHWMARLEEPHYPRGCGVPILHRDDAGRDAIAPGPLCRRRHGPRGFARSHHQHPPARRLANLAQGTGGERGIEEGAGGLQEGKRASFASRRPASISMSSVLGKQKRILVRPRSLVE